MMKWHRALPGLIFVLIVGTGSAYAAEPPSIKGRLGITARGGAIYTSSTASLGVEPSYVLGGGLIYGITHILAVEADVAHAPNIQFNNVNGNLSTTDVSVGLQIRNRADEFTAYLGIGGDALLIDAQNVDADTQYGGHVRAGVDYFFNKDWAFNVDAKGVFFATTDLRQGGIPVAKYDPTGFIGTIGVRFFLP